MCVSLFPSVSLSQEQTIVIKRSHYLSVLGLPLYFSPSLFSVRFLSLPLTMHSLMGLTVHCLSNGSLCLSSSLSLSPSLSLPLLEWLFATLCFYISLSFRHCLCLCSLSLSINVFFLSSLHGIKSTTIQ